MGGNPFRSTPRSTLTAFCLLLSAVASCQATAAPRSSADTLMQAVIERDAETGWRQLCPAVQAQLPLAVIHDQAAAQRATDRAKGLELTLDFIGSRPQPDGGEIRLYVVTARYPNGTTERRTYTVRTLASGCVAEID